MERLSVPLIKQQSELACGVAALRMVLQYYGKDVSSEEIIKSVGGVTKQGIKVIKLAEFARSLGFDVECYSYNEKLAKDKAKIKKPSKSDLIKFLKRKVPVIIAVRSFLLFNNKPSKMGHFIVITGYDDGIFLYNDPWSGEEHSIKEEELMFAWFNNILESSGYLIAIQLKS